MLPRIARTCQPLRDERGAAMVEFALVLPLMLLLLLGMVDFGRALNYWLDENHLASQAARAAAVDRNPGGGSSICASIKEQADTTELRNGLRVEITYPQGPAVGNPVKARLSYDHTWMPFIARAVEPLGINPYLTIAGTAVMRVERVPASGGGCTA